MSHGAGQVDVDVDFMPFQGVGRRLGGDEVDEAEGAADVAMDPMVEVEGPADVAMGAADVATPTGEHTGEQSAPVTPTQAQLAEVSSIVRTFEDCRDVVASWLVDGEFPKELCERTNEFLMETTLAITSPLLDLKDARPMLVHVVNAFRQLDGERKRLTTQPGEIVLVEDEGHATKRRRFTTKRPAEHETT